MVSSCHIVTVSSGGGGLVLAVVAVVVSICSSGRSSNQGNCSSPYIASPMTL